MRTALHLSILNEITRQLPDGFAWSRSGIEAASIPKGIRHFIVHVLDRRIELETESIHEERSGWIDYTSTDVIEAQTRLRDAFLSSARLPGDEGPAVLRQAVEQVTNYLVEPLSTMIEFVFPEHAESTSSGDAVRRANYFSDYSHLAAAVSAFVQHRNVERISRSDLRSTLRQIDGVISGSFSGEDWTHHLGPLFDLLRFGNPGAGGVAPELLAASFSDRGHTSLSSRLLSYYSSAGLDIVSREDLSASIDASMEATQLPVVSDSEPGVPLWKRFSGDEGVSPPDTAGPSPVSDTPDSVPLWMKFAEAESSSTGERIVDSAEQRHHDPVAKRSDAVESENIERRVLGSAVERSTEFREVLFGGNSDDYRRVLQAIDAAENWTEATRILAGQVFRKYGVDIYSDIAVAFTDAVDVRFKHD
jgi:hypothetical protein